MSIRTALSLAFVATLSAAAASSPEQAAQARRALELAPVRFEQAAPSHFVARGLGYQMSLTATGATVTTPERSLRIVFPGANPAARMEGVDLARTRTDYFLGADRSQWRTGVPTYNRVRCVGVYPGIDLVYYSAGGRLEYDFIVAPGADPGRIRVKFHGADETHVGPDGDLLVRAGGATLIQRKPTLYQRGEETTSVRGSYRMARNGAVGFTVGEYDRSRELVIDPVLTYSSYLSGLGGDFITALAADSQGHLVVAGYTTGSNIWVYGNTVNTTPPGEKDIFVIKLDPTVPPEVSLMYASYMGGTADDTPKAVTVDKDGLICITGTTTSTDLPVSSDAAGKSRNGSTGSDAFFARISTDTGLVYSTYFGGSGNESAETIAYDGVSKIVVAGNTSSTDLPVTFDALQTASGGLNDGFVTVYERYSDGSTAQIYTSYYGGEATEIVRSVAFGPDGGIWLTGLTTSTSLPLGGDPFRSAGSGAGDAFVTKLTLPAGGQGASVAYATYLGGNSLDDPKRVLVDSAGGVIVVGYTLSSDFPLSFDAIQRDRRGTADLFVSRLDPSKPAAEQLIYSTLLGGAGTDAASSAALDSENTVWVTGYTMSGDFPLAGASYQSTVSGLTDGFLVRIDPAKGTQGLLYSTYLGSTSLDSPVGVVALPESRVAVAGVTASRVFPAGNSYVREQTSGSWGSFVVALDPR
jgi:hypothetical protein